MLVLCWEWGVGDEATMSSGVGGLTKNTIT